MMRNLIALCLVSVCLSGQAIQFQRPSGTDSNSVYNIALTAANTVGGATNGITAATGANIAQAISATNNTTGRAGFLSGGTTNTTATNISAAAINTEFWRLNTPTNGSLIATQFNNELLAFPIAPGPGFWQPDANKHIWIGAGDLRSGPFGGWWYWHDHGGPGKPELLWWSSHSLAWGAGQSGAAGSWGTHRHLQEGIGARRQWSYMQLDWDRTQLNYGAPVQSAGWSAIRSWRSAYWDGASQIDRFIGTQARTLNTNNGLSELVFWGNFDGTIDADGTNWNWDAWYPQFRIYYGGSAYNGQGADVRGVLTREQYPTTPASTNVPVNYYLGGTINVDASALTNLTFYTTNFSGHSTNSERLTVLVRANGGAPTLTYPAWNIATNTGALPSALTADQFLKLEIESLGAGESNKWVVGYVGRDVSFSWDTDALDWFSRAATTNAQSMAAVNAYVKALKAANCYTNLKVLNIPLQDNATHNAECIIGTDWTFTSVTHTNSLGFNGTSSFANTGYNPTSSGGWSQNSAFLAIYSTTATINDGVSIGGAQSGSTERAYFRRNGTTAYMNGLNNNFGFASLLPSSDWSGLWIGNRTGSTGPDNSFYLRGLSVVDSSGNATTGNINANFYVGARNQSGTADLFAACNVRLVAIGAGMDSTKLAAFQTATSNLKTALGWP